MRPRILVSILTAALWGSPCVRAAERPSFIVVFIDDMGYGDLSSYGNAAVETVHIDRLAEEGLRFTQFYVNSPICSPSRTAITTGRFPLRWRITSYLDSRSRNEERGMAQWLDPKAPTLARMLQKAGYATGHFGKWHMGGQRDVGDAPLITEYGFDDSLTQFEGLGDRILGLCDARDGKPPRKHALGSDQLGRGKITWMDRAEVTSGFVDRAIAFIEKAERNGRPFYVNVWPDDVHSPFFPPAELRGDGTKKGLYHGVLKNMDRQLGVLFDRIRDSPRLRERTLILLASDNGPEPGAGSAGGLRGHKANLYEGGIRSPLIIWGPGLLAKGRAGGVNSRTVISSVDIPPSLLSLAGVKGPPDVGFDGQDLSRSLLGVSEEIRARPLLWNRPPDRRGEGAERWPDLAIRDGDWKLLIMEDGSEAQLYDLAEDSGESRNVAGRHPEVVERLSRRLRDWWRSF